MSRSISSCAVVVCSLLFGACADTATAPVTAGSELSAVKFWEAGSSLGWNATARNLVVSSNPFVQVRVLTYLSVAQYNAVIAAENATQRGDHASPAMAAAGASLVVLKSFFPADGATLDAQLAAQLAAPTWPGGKHTDTERGEAIGRSIGAAVVAYASTDGLNSVVPTPKTGTPSVYYWTSSLVPPAPAALGLHGARPFALRSPDQFRPNAPPPFESEEFQDALHEVRAISDTRTDEQREIAQKWAARGPAYWNSEAAAMIIGHRQSERRAAHTLALANMAGFDAQIGCWDAKFEYWTARPTKVDDQITLAVPLPNFPSYPSGHSCTSGAYVTVLSSMFAEETDGLQAQLDEVGLARVYGGLHFQFDCDVGRVLGREVAEYVMGQGAQGHEPIALD